MPNLFPSKHIIKVLLNNGFSLKSQKGSHQKYIKNSNTVIIPHPKKEIPLNVIPSTNPYNSNTNFGYIPTLNKINRFKILKLIKNKKFIYPETEKLLLGIADKYQGVSYI